MIEMVDVKKEYRLYGQNIPVLNDVNLRIDDGEFCAIIGRSGCGKTTLLNILGFMDSLTSGLYKFDGLDVSRTIAKEAAGFRQNKIGYIFQSFYLINGLTALENVAMPLGYAGVAKKNRTERAFELLTRVGLEQKVQNPVQKLSGGEQQRVAIARALVASPRVVLADEPTGNLDEENRDIVMNLLSDIHNDGMTIIMVTHDMELTRYASRVLRMREGLILE